MHPVPGVRLSILPGLTDGKIARVGLVWIIGFHDFAVFQVINPDIGGIDPSGSIRLVTKKHPMESTGCANDACYM